MAITYVGGQVNGRAGSNSTASVTFALTGGSNSTPQAGDLVVIGCTVASAGRTPNCAISGYSSGTQQNANGTTYDTSLNKSWKFMGLTPDTTFTLPSTGNNADAQRYTVQVWRGVNPAVPFDVDDVVATGTGTGRPNPGSITPTTSGAVVGIIGAGAAATGAAYTAPANYTTNFLTGTTADTNDAMIGSGYRSWTSGAEDPAAYTGGTANAVDSWAAFTYALRPAVIHDVSSTEPLSAADSSSPEVLQQSYANGYGAASSRINGFSYLTETGFTLSLAFTYALSSVFVQSDTAGYITPNDTSSTYKKLTFSTETQGDTSATAPTNRYSFSGVYSGAKGYRCGGIFSAVYYGDMSAITYSSETTGSIGVSMVTARYNATGLSSGTVGYNLGGIKSGTLASTEVDGIIFATETQSNPGSALIGGEGHGGGTSEFKGYMFGGTGQTIDAWSFTYATETAADLTASLTVARNTPYAISNNVSFYVFGGGGSPFTTVDKLDISTDAISSVSQGAAVSDSGAAAARGVPINRYTSFERQQSTTTDIGGIGYSVDGLAQTSAIDRPSKDNEANAAGYFGKGFHPNNGNDLTVDKLVFVSETSYPVSVTLAEGAMLEACGVWDKGNGIFFDGDTDGINFPTETAINPSMSRGGAYEFGAGVSSPTNGYVMGGYAASTLETHIQKIAFPTITRTVLSGTMTEGRYAGAPAQSTTKGYVLGGRTATYTTAIDSVAFSSDTVATPSVTLSRARAYTAGISSLTTGYAVGGTSTLSIPGEIDGIVFASETAVNPSAAVVNNNKSPSGTYDAYTGFICGGDLGVNVYTLTARRFIFSTETLSDNTAALYSYRRNAVALTYTPGDVHQGSFSGDLTASDSSDSIAAGSIIDEAANSTSEQSAVGPDLAMLTESGSAEITTSMARIAIGSGAIIGGSNGGGALQTTIDVLNFYDDAVSAAGANLGTAMAGAASANGESTGFFVGGKYTGIGTQDDVISWSFETATGTATANTVSARYRFASTQSETKAFFAGGLNSVEASVSEVDAIAIPSGTSSNPTAVLASARRSTGGVSSATVGYYPGGETDTPTVLTGIEVLTFSSETMATSSEVLDAARRRQTSAYSATDGYLFAGADDTYSYTWVDKLTYANTTMSAVNAYLATARTEAAGLQSGSKAYICGGWTDVTVTTADIESFVFSNETIGNPTANLSVSRGTSAGVSQINNSIQAVATTESGAATAAHVVSSSEAAAHSASGTASDAHGAAASYLLSVSEAGVATDLSNGTFNYAVALLANTSSDDTKSAIFTLLGAQSESSSATEAETVAAAFVSAQTEPGTAVDTKTVAAAFVSSEAESASAADTPSGTYATTSDTTETGAASDAKDSVQAQPVSRTEPSAADDATTVQTAFVSAKSEPATATDAPTGVYTTSSTQTESSTPTDSESAIAAFVSSTTEPGAATEANDGISGATAAQDELGSAADTKTAQAAFVSTAEEPLSATASQDFTYLATATIIEAGTAGSSEIGIYIASISHTEPANANALHDGSTVAGGTTHSVDQAESGASSEEESVTAVFVGSAAEPAGGVDTLTASAVFVTDSSESATGSETASVVRGMDSDSAEQGSATDQSNFISANLAAINESGAAVDAGYGTYITAVSITNPATALAEQAYDAIKYSVQEENGLAVDFSSSTITFFVSNDETAAAFDLSSVQSVFVVSFTADGQAVEQISVAADFIASINEAAAAVSASARWLAGSEFAKTTAVFVATTSEGRVVCYLKPVPTALASVVEPTVFAETSEQRTVAELRAVASFVAKDPEA